MIIINNIMESKVEERTPMHSEQDTPFGLEKFQEAIRDFTRGGSTPMRAESCRMLMMYEGLERGDGRPSPIRGGRPVDVPAKRAKHA